MKLLADQDVYGLTVRFLRELGHDVVAVADIGLAQSSDEELLQTAQRKVEFSLREIETSEPWYS